MPTTPTRGLIDLRFLIEPKPGWRWSEDGRRIVNVKDPRNWHSITTMIVMDDINGMIDRTVDPADLAWHIADIGELK